jgi:hypothetical protein
MPDALTPAELAEATGKARAASQAAALAKLGVPFTYSGRAVILDRGIAVAHNLLQDAKPSSGVNWSQVR